jgi:hypothetical protein
MTLDERVDALARRPEFAGDREAVRQGLAARSSDPDPLVLVAFQPVDKAAFERRGAELLTARGARLVVHSGEGRLAPGTVALFKNLPGGVAHVSYSTFQALLDAGLIRTFTWAPEVRMGTETGTPLSVVGDKALEAKFRAAGVSSALDLVSKAANPESRDELARASGLEAEALGAIVARVRGQLTADERHLLENTPALPFVPGILPKRVR